MKFRKKPVVIEAQQFRGTNDSADEIVKWMTGEGIGVWAGAQGSGPVHFLTIPTLEGEMRADAGDWIIRGIKGEFYPCKPDIFSATYEPVE